MLILVIMVVDGVRMGMGIVIVVMIMSMLVLMHIMRMVVMGGRFSMVMAVASPEKMEVDVSPRAFQALPQHPEADGQDQEGRKQTQPAVQLFLCVGFGEDFGDDAEDYDTEGVGKGDNDA